MMLRGNDLALKQSCKLLLLDRHGGRGLPYCFWRRGGSPGCLSSTSSLVRMARWACGWCCSTCNNSSSCWTFRGWYRCRRLRRSAFESIYSWQYFKTCGVSEMGIGANPGGSGKSALGIGRPAACSFNASCNLLSSTKIARPDWPHQSRL